MNRSTRLGSILAVSLLSTAAQAATYTVDANVSSGAMNSPGPSNHANGTGDVPISRSTNSFQTGTSEGPGDRSGSASGSSSAAASSSAGAVRLQAFSAFGFASYNGGFAVGGAGSSASGRIDDRFTILAPTCSDMSLCGPGARGMMTFSIAISGNANGSGTYSTTSSDGGNGGWYGSASWSSNGIVQSGLGNASWTRGESYGANQGGVIDDTTSGSGIGSESHTIDFLFGETIYFTLVGEVASQAGGGYDFYTGSADQKGASSGSAGFSADLGNTIAWGGVSELRDANGNQLSQWTALNSEGDFDYRFAAAVPEPAASWMFLAGAATLAAFVRRRGQQRGRGNRGELRIGA